MNKIFLTLFVLSLSYQLTAQNDLWLISFYGTEYSDNNIRVSASAGEPMIETFRTDELILTQGFHQSLSYGGTYTTEISADLTLTIYPNPFADALVLEFVRDGMEYSAQYELQILDILGRSYYEDRIQPNMESKRIINTSGLNPGIYLLQIRVADQSSIAQTFKLIKN